jgi:hypothetical protein
MSSTGAKGSQQTNTKIKERVQNKRAKDNPKAALTVSGAPGNPTPNLPPSGILGATPL